jgi:hypothetical protein
MQKNKIIFLVLISFHSYSADILAPLEMLKKVNDSDLVCESPTDRDFSNCLADICGPKDVFQSSEDVFNSLANSKASNDGKFAPLKKNIEDYYSKNINNSKLSLQRLKKNLDEGNIELVPELIGFHKLLELIPSISKVDLSELVEEQLILAGRLKLTLNSEKLDVELTKVYGEARARRFKAPFLELMTNDNIQKIYYGYSLGWSLYMEQMYPGKNLKELIEIQGQENDKIIKEFAVKSPALLKLLSTQELVKTDIIEQIKKAENPSEQLLGQYFHSVIMLGLVKDYLITGQPHFDQFKPENIYDIYGKEALSKKIDENLEKLNALTPQSPEIQQNVQHCQAIFEKSQSGLPTAIERQNFLKTIENHKTKFKTNILGRLSAHSTSVLAPSIDKINFDVPASKESYAAHMAAEFTDAISRTDKYQLLLQNSSPSEVLNYSMLSIHDLMNQSHEEFTGELAETCEEYELGHLEDHSIQIGSGKIKVSWLTLKVPEMGKGIIAHELAHALSGIIQNTEISVPSAETYSTARLCLNEGFPQVGMTKEYVNDKTYETNMFVEENWADVVSSKFAEPSDKNFACFLVDKTDEGDYNSNVFLPQHEEDTHSPNLYRILKVEYLKNKKLPVSCTDLLSAEETATIRRDCYK